MDGCAQRLVVFMSFYVTASPSFVYTNSQRRDWEMCAECMIIVKSFLDRGLMLFTARRIRYTRYIVFNGGS